MLDYLHQHPTADEILAEVHGVKTKGRKVDPNRFEDEFNQLPQFTGQTPESFDPEMRESIQWGSEMTMRMKKEKVN